MEESWVIFAEKHGVKVVIESTTPEENPMKAGLLRIVMSMGKWTSSQIMPTHYFLTEDFSFDRYMIQQIEITMRNWVAGKSNSMLNQKPSGGCMMC